MTAVEAYKAGGLRAVSDLYLLFPERLQSLVLERHAAVWRELSGQLTPDERASLEEYELAEPLPNDEEVATYEERLRELETKYEERKEQRLREAASLLPAEAVSTVDSFERAHQRLVEITCNLLSQARRRLERQQRREREALAFA